MPLLICPNCEVGMNEIQRNGVSIDICPKCKGVWLDGGEMEKLLSQVRQYEQEYESRLESYRKQYGSLPTHQRNPYDTDDDGGHKRHGKKKSRLARLFDLFD